MQAFGEPKLSPISMTHADDGTSLANYRWWTSSRDPGRDRGVYLLHGLSEYAGRYEHVADWLNARGWQVGSHDHRGHGRSGGQRASVRRPEDLIHDAEQRIADFTRELGQPPVLLGHSMGGLVATHVALRGQTPLAGLILCSPAFRLQLGSIAYSLIKLGNRVFPCLPLPHRRYRPQLTHDQVVADTYQRDPLVNRVVTPRLVHFIWQAGVQALAQASQLSQRTLLLVAGEDHVVDPEGSRAFADAAPPGKIALRWYEATWHELLNETQDRAQPVYADMDRWLSGV